MNSKFVFLACALLLTQSASAARARKRVHYQDRKGVPKNTKETSLLWTPRNQIYIHADKFHRRVPQQTARTVRHSRGKKRREKALTDQCCRSCTTAPLKKRRNHKRRKERLKKRQKPAAKVVGDEGRRAAGRHADADAGLQIRMIIPTPDLNLSTPKWGPKQIMIPNGTKIQRC